jgi:hypothetical protein
MKEIELEIEKLVGYTHADDDADGDAAGRTQFRKLGSTKLGCKPGRNLSDSELAAVTDRPTIR